MKSVKSANRLQFQWGYRGESCPSTAYYISGVVVISVNVLTVLTLLIHCWLLVFGLKVAETNIFEISILA